MKILYITTFNKRIWEVSASKLIESFFKINMEEDILLCFEGMKFDLNDSNIISSKKIREKYKERFKLYNLDKDVFLQDWLSSNKDVIPKEMGGLANKEKTPQAYLPWNFRAAGWFRKIATLNYALSKYSLEYDALVFLDADSTLINKIDSSLIETAFNSKSFFYHWGNERPKKGLGVESGLIGFKMDEEGIFVLKKWIEYFENKKFRRYLMWDDGGAFGNIVLEMKELYQIEGSDLVINYKDNGKSQSHVIERGMFKDYFVHNKGFHKKANVI